MIQFLTRDKYFKAIQKPENKYFRINANGPDRWDYHCRAIDLLKGLGLQHGHEVLELGSMGMRCVHHSHTIDHPVMWKLPYAPTFNHNLLHLPWPIQDRQYKAVVALRVLMHLAPKQTGCLQECVRVARHTIVLVPEKYRTRSIKTATGMSYEFVTQAMGAHPNAYIMTKYGGLYHFDTDNPSGASLKHKPTPGFIFKTHSNSEPEQEPG